ncbi:hypothetical protein T492DRAFT_1044248 [Pavlovales sp. CCMP2436]|nr:hypothetical protein T492DRAFT_1044248 [Pavlovales sp. CCMP2436]
MLHSIATSVGKDVVLMKRLEQGQVHKFIAIYRAEPLNSLLPYSANGNGKFLIELIAESRNGGRMICVISIDEGKTHVEATDDSLTQGYRLEGYPTGEFARAMRDAYEQLAGRRQRKLKFGGAEEGAPEILKTRDPAGPRLEIPEVLCPADG